MLLSLVPLLLLNLARLAECSRVVNVHVIYTGGTIGMVYDTNGELIPGPASAFRRDIQHVADNVLNARQRATLDMKIMITEIEPLLDSCNIGIHEWNMMSDAIVESPADAFIIIHGTDTMAYTSSALSFMLYNLRKPIVITGSQIPMCNPNSDGAANLAGSFNAVRMLFSKEIHAVAVYFAQMLMRGVTVTKSSAVRLDAFDNPGSTPFAIVAEKVQMERSRYDFSSADNYIRLVANFANGIPFHVTPLHNKVAIFMITPDFSMDLLRGTLENSDGLLLMTYGANNVPSNREELMSVLAHYVAQGKLIVSISQVFHKANTKSEYETGNVMRKIGVVDGNAMTMEAAFTKIRWLLATSLNAQQKRDAMRCDFMGEYPGINHDTCYDLWTQIGQ